jgi:hypothetical protein
MIYCNLLAMRTAVLPYPITHSRNLELNSENLGVKKLRQQNEAVEIILKIACYCFVCWLITSVNQILMLFIPTAVTLSKISIQLAHNLLLLSPESVRLANSKLNWT